jgi:hypothetical protein
MTLETRELLDTPDASVVPYTLLLLVHFVRHLYFGLELGL